MTGSVATSSLGRIHFNDGTSSYCLGSDTGGPALTDREIRWVLTHWLAIEPWSIQLRSFVAREIRVEARTDDALVDRMCALLSSRGLTLSRDERMAQQDPSPQLEVAEIPTEPLQATANEAATHWIHVIVVNHEDRPLAGVKYRLELTDGRVQEGCTDTDGGVHVDEIPAGVCRIALLDLDEDEWGPGS